MLIGGEVCAVMGGQCESAHIHVHIFYEGTEQQALAVSCGVSGESHPSDIHMHYTVVPGIALIEFSRDESIAFNETVTVDIHEVIELR
jgi:hypothetical protein